MFSGLLPRRRSPPATGTPADPTLPSEPPPDLERIPDRTLVPQLGPAPALATETLYARLTAEDISEVKARLTDDHRAAWDHASPLDRMRLALGLGLLYGVDGVAARTGLTAAEPPAGVHLMARGVLDQIGGAYLYADMVLEWLTVSGQALEPGDHVLDFSCSSGRVVRALAAALPDIRWHGCDPNVGAISWARQKLPAVDFRVSETSPPLQFEDGFFDAVFAISVWSHFSAEAAMRWLEEMHRVIRPGGHLVLTTHGLQSCVWFSHARDLAIEARLGRRWIKETGGRLQRDGHCFWSVFGPGGDEGVVADGWGLAFFTPEWLLEAITPAWSVTMYRIGRADGNQDAFALERR